MAWAQVRLHHVYHATHSHDVNIVYVAGHYTAFANNSQAWFNFNDLNVKETDFQTVQSSRAYILFYVQRDFYKG